MTLCFSIKSLWHLVVIEDYTALINKVITMTG